MKLYHRPTKGNRLYLVAVISLFWLGVTLLVSIEPAQTIGLDGRITRTPWTKVFRAHALGYFWWLLFTPVVMMLARRFRFTPGRIPRNFALHASASMAISGAIAVLRFATFSRLFEGRLPEQSEIIANLRFYTPQGVGIYWLVLAVIVAVDTYQRFLEKQTEASELNAQLAQAELSMLRMQFQPHFLYNALHAISTLVDWRPVDARRMITLLSELLRQTVDAEPRSMVTLEEELEWIERYLELERIRFEDRLTVAMEIDPAAFEALVPSFILQPLVENAMKHGVDGETSAVNVTIRAERVDGKLRLAVLDDGVGLRADVAYGVGLDNTRRRLESLYGRSQRLDLCPRARGVEAAIELPFRIENGRNDSAIPNPRR
jgi:hypothetical protein